MLLFAVAHIVTGCSDFLAEENKVDIEKEGFLTTTEQAETVLFGIYQTTTADAMYGYYLSFYFSMGTDCEQATCKCLPDNTVGSTAGLAVSLHRYLSCQ